MEQPDSIVGAEAGFLQEGCASSRHDRYEEVRTGLVSGWGWLEQNEDNDPKPEELLMGRGLA
jgi:hypothetical protein